jgi:hypothetical protein
MKVSKVRPQKAISDFGTFTVTCTHADKPLSAGDSVLLETIKKALLYCIQNQSVPELDTLGKGNERRFRPKHQDDEKILAKKN